ncbi:hypothetical protein BKA62DRAFT_676852 [Auriculariales sp. MPI-PUGE-AT-0066]|nr:hypothetical protein BKA62DRAFT_676852 [Auriculariales sp. MPI-PUGE-AT-0066]
MVQALSRLLLGKCVCVVLIIARSVRRLKRIKAFNGGRLTPDVRAYFLCKWKVYLLDLKCTGEFPKRAGVGLAHSDLARINTEVNQSSTAEDNAVADESDYISDAATIGYNRDYHA